MSEQRSQEERVDELARWALGSPEPVPAAEFVTRVHRGVSRQRLRQRATGALLLVSMALGAGFFFGVHQDDISLQASLDFSGTPPVQSERVSVAELQEIVVYEAPDDWLLSEETLPDDYLGLVEMGIVL